MKKLFLSDAVLLLAQDAKQLKRVCGFRKTVVEFYSDYIEAEYRFSDIVRCIPDNRANEWRIYADGDELVFVLTYYFEPDSDEKKC